MTDIDTPEKAVSYLMALWNGKARQMTANASSRVSLAMERYTSMLEGRIPTPATLKIAPANMLLLLKRLEKNNVTDLPSEENAFEESAKEEDEKIDAAQDILAGMLVDRRFESHCRRDGRLRIIARFFRGETANLAYKLSGLVDRIAFPTGEDALKQVKMRADKTEILAENGRQSDVSRWIALYGKKNANGDEAFEGQHAETRKALDDLLKMGVCDLPFPLNKKDDVATDIVHKAVLAERLRASFLLWSVQTICRIEGVQSRASEEQIQAGLAVVNDLLVKEREDGPVFTRAQNILAEELGKAIQAGVKLALPHETVNPEYKAKWSKILSRACLLDPKQTVARERSEAPADPDLADCEKTLRFALLQSFSDAFEETRTELYRAAQQRDLIHIREPILDKAALVHVLENDLSAYANIITWTTDHFLADQSQKRDAKQSVALPERPENVGVSKSAEPRPL